MAFTGEYKCSRCGKIEKRELLVVKKIMFQSIGVKPTTIRSRVEGWYCPSCVAKDEQWKLPAYSSPGMQPAPTHPKTPDEEELRREAIRRSQEAYDEAWSHVED